MRKFEVMMDVPITIQVVVEAGTMEEAITEGASQGQGLMWKLLGKEEERVEKLKKPSTPHLRTVLDVGTAKTVQVGEA